MKTKRQPGSNHHESRKNFVFIGFSRTNGFFGNLTIPILPAENDPFQNTW